jgi:hypothetical protein
MITMKTELLEYLVRQCVREVLDQMEEEVNVSKLKSSSIGKDDNKEPAKQKTTVPVKPFKTGKGFKKNIKKINEQDEPKGDTAPPADGQGTGDQPAVPKEEPPKPEEPKPEAPPQRIPKGAVLINPKDKSKLQPIKWQGRDESAIERTLHQTAVSVSGPRTKVSLGAKRLAREVMANPNSTVYFYIGKMDPESEEVFLMADKSLQIAKDDSAQPGELMGTPVSTPPSPTLNYGAMNDDEYTTYMNTRNQAKPRYGIDESAAIMIKKAVNKILDS